MRSTITLRLAIAKWSRRRRRHVMLGRLSTGRVPAAGRAPGAAVAVMVVRLPSAVSGVLDPWVDDDEQDVEQGVDDDEDHRDQQDCPAQDGVVALADRLDREAADPRPGED